MPPLAVLASFELDCKLSCKATNLKYFPKCAHLEHYVSVYYIIICFKLMRLTLTQSPAISTGSGTPTYLFDKILGFGLHVKRF